MLKNEVGKFLVVNNIWFNTIQNKFIYPNFINNDFILNNLQKHIQTIMSLQGNSNILGLINDDEVLKDINENKLAYLWERAMPASEFMPVLGYLKIAERYLFASKFINKDDIVLEAPCGFGYGASMLSKYCKEVEAIDIARDNIDFASNAYPMSNILWKEGDVLNLNYPDSKFNIYVSFEVFEHLEVDKTEKYLEEAYRVLKDNGLFIISTPDAENMKHINNPFHIKEYTKNEFEAQLKRIFRDVELYYVKAFAVEKGISKDSFNLVAVCKK